MCYYRVSGDSSLRLTALPHSTSPEPGRSSGLPPSQYRGHWQNSRSASGDVRYAWGMHKIVRVPVE